MVRGFEKGFEKSRGCSSSCWGKTIVFGKYHRYRPLKKKVIIKYKNMDWKKDYRNIFCTGKKCQCHKEVEDFISETLKERDREIKNLIAKEILKNKNLEVLTGLSHALNIINKNIRK